MVTYKRDIALEALAEETLSNRCSARKSGKLFITLNLITI
jgi:hypothetical protein